MEEDRLSELVEYTRRQVAARQSAGITPADGSEVHVHYHAAPVPVAEKPDVLARYVPHIILMMFCLVILGGLAVVLVMLTPVLVAITGSIVALVIAAAAAVGAVAVLMVGLSAAVKSIRETPAKAAKRR